VVGEAVPIEATVFKEGHDAVGATAVLVSPTGQVTRWPMTELSRGLARWGGSVVPDALGEWSFRVEGWFDPYATWHHDAVIKVEADVDTDLMLEMGARLLEQAATALGGEAPAKGQGGGKHAKELTDGPAADGRQLLIEAAAKMRNGALPAAERLAAGAGGEVFDLMRAKPLRLDVTKSATYHLVVQRERALVGSWYEVFPRSVGATFSPETGWVTGNFKTLAANLDRIAEMGFDVLYLTPIHPIGATNRKGRNNSLNARPTDPGSPYAIGTAEGGHDALHPDLGSFDDFDALVARSRLLGMEVAMDIALQCSPDHPWVKSHPEWFIQRPDGSIAYAENPPKKYQDIYPLSFDQDPDGLYLEILRIIRLWVSHGVTIFRVDNPHTKPLVFWERLIAQIAAESPDVIFLSEAFTRPPMMHTLALVGFQQSYTYFAWRNTKEEVCEYLEELAGEWGSFMRPSLWPTTHDILTPYMQQGGLAAHRIRAILAATGAPNYGIYTGYELVEDVARPGAEEAIDNEKYEYKIRDFNTPVAQELSALLTLLNRIKRQHVALRRLRNLTIHTTTDDSTICFSRHVPAEHSPDGKADTIVVLLNLDPHSVREGEVQFDLEALGLDPDQDSFEAYDLLSDQAFTWGETAFFRLDPNGQAGHVVHVR